jgi:hypothetical protein
MTMTSARAGVAVGDLAGSSPWYGECPFDAGIDEFAAFVASRLL